MQPQLALCYSKLQYVHLAASPPRHNLSFSGTELEEESTRVGLKRKSKQQQIYFALRFRSSREHCSRSSSFVFFFFFVSSRSLLFRYLRASELDWKKIAAARRIFMQTPKLPPLLLLNSPYAAVGSNRFLSSLFFSLLRRAQIIGSWTALRTQRRIPTSIQKELEMITAQFFFRQCYLISQLRVRGCVSLKLPSQGKVWPLLIDRNRFIFKPYGQLYLFPWKGNNRIIRRILRSIKKLKLSTQYEVWGLYKVDFFVIYLS